MISPCHRNITLEKWTKNPMRMVRACPCGKRLHTQSSYPMECLCHCKLAYTGWSNKKQQKQQPHEQSSDHMECICHCKLAYTGWSNKKQKKQPSSVTPLFIPSSSLNPFTAQGQTKPPHPFFPPTKFSPIHSTNLTFCPWSPGNPGSPFSPTMPGSPGRPGSPSLPGSPGRPGRPGSPIPG